MGYWIGFSVLAAGSVICGQLGLLNSVTSWSLIIFASLLLVIAGRKNGILLATMLGVAVIVLGVRSGQVMVEESSYQLDKPIVGTVLGKVSSQLEQHSSSVQFIIDDVSIYAASDEAWPGKVKVAMPLHTDIQYGDIVKLEGELSSVLAVEDEGYRSYLINHRIFGEMRWPDFEVIDRNQGNSLVAWGMKIQQSANNALIRLLPQDLAAYLSGVVLGAMMQLSEEFSDALKTTGTTHLIVASGYNISILVGLVMKLTGYLSKRNSIILSLGLIACYVLISGLDPSIIRASLMSGLAITASLMGRQKVAWHALCSAAILMLIWNPLWLFDVGFQLSFAATAGILAFQPLIYSQCSKIDWLGGGAKEAISTTMAAQLTVVPIIATTFSKISIISLLTNLLVSWVTPIIMFGGIMIILLSLLSTTLASLAATLLYPLLLLTKEIILFTSKIPYAFIGVTVGLVPIAVYYYFLMLYYKWSQKESYVE